MQVGKNNVSQFLTSNNICFVIPVYQRNYDWNDDNCKQLWDDIWYLSKTQDTTHFLGTICSSGIISHEKTIIDGQQRITSITLLIKAIHDSSADPGLKNYLYDKYLCNTGYGIPQNHKIKLQLNTRDDSIYRKLLSSDVFTDASDLNDQMVDSRLYQNYLFFYNYVKNLNSDSVMEIINALERLIIVELDIENEDPQEIFESLNSTGLDLTDVDLIRNFLLMSLDRETQKHFYESYWYPIEENIGHSSQNMVRFFIDYYIYTRKSDNLTLRGRRAHITAGHLYDGYKEHYKNLCGSENKNNKSPDITENLLSDMLRCSVFYKKLVFGNGIDMNSLSEMDKIIYSIVYINEAVTSRPILMYIIEKYQNNQIEESEAIEMLKACLSMVFRSKVTRSTGMSGQFVGNMLLRLSENDDSNYVDRFWKAITAGRGNFAFPSNEDFRYALCNRQIFDILRSKGMKYLLYSLEQATPYSKGLPRYDDQNITIEHIMPKSLSPEWEQYLGDSANRHGDYLNKLGNLTLTNNNPEMSNDPFDEKKEWYSESSFHYTRKLADIDHWSMEKITRRSEHLTNKCIDVWYFPSKYHYKIEEVVEEQKNRRPSFKFSMIGVEIGEEVQYIEDPSIIATVTSDTQVSYKGKNYSLSKLVSVLKGSKGHSYSGIQYFTYKGERLTDIRNEIESYVH